MKDIFLSLDKFLSKDMFTFIMHPQFEGVLLYVKVLFIVISLVLLMLIIYLLIKTTWVKIRVSEDLTEFVSYKSSDAKETSKEWDKIIERLESGKETEYKLAVIEADSLLDDTLKRMGYAGETIGDRLKQIDSTIMPDIEQVWEAHKIRNNIVHNPDYHLDYDKAKRVLGIYEEVLKKLEAF